MAVYREIPKKLILKWNKELVELHKRVITSHLVSRGISFKTRTKIFKLYDIYIDEENIECYFFTPTPLLIRGLVLNNLKDYAIYIYKDHGSRSSKTHKRKVSV